MQDTQATLADAATGVDDAPATADSRDEACDDILSDMGERKLRVADHTVPPSTGATIKGAAGDGPTPLGTRPV